jgi:hypothetical protein
LCAVFVELVDQGHADRIQHAARGDVRCLGDSDQRPAGGDRVSPPPGDRGEGFPGKALAPGARKQLVGDLGARFTPVVRADGHQADRPLVGNPYDSPGASRLRGRGLSRGDALFRSRTAEVRTGPVVGQQLAYEEAIFVRDRAQQKTVGAQFGGPDAVQGNADGVHEGKPASQRRCAGRLHPAVGHGGARSRHQRCRPMGLSGRAG